jgi:hypothetical protein
MLQMLLSPQNIDQRAGPFHGYPVKSSPAGLPNRNPAPQRGLARSALSGKMTEMAGPQLIDSEPRAQQLARAIASDISLYNREKIEAGLREDNLFAALADEINEGRELYRSRVTPEVFRRNFFDRALIDRLLKPMGTLALPIW